MSIEAELDTNVLITMLYSLLQPAAKHAFNYLGLEELFTSVAENLYAKYGKVETLENLKNDPDTPLYIACNDAFFMRSLLPDQPLVAGQLKSWHESGQSFKITRNASITISQNVMTMPGGGSDQFLGTETIGSDAPLQARKLLIGNALWEDRMLNYFPYLIPICDDPITE